MDERLTPSGVFRGLRSARAGALLGAMVVLGCVLAGLDARATADHIIRFTQSQIGTFPPDFESSEPGGSVQGSWEVVPDPSSHEQVALEQASRGLLANTHPIVVYQPVLLKNVDVRARFKIVSGQMKNAGIAVRYQEQGTYYVIVASALEQRVDLFRALGGRLIRTAGIEAPVSLDDWQELRVIAQDRGLAVLLNGTNSFSAADEAITNSGRVALWTEEDNVTRFDRLTIKALP